MRYRLALCSLGLCAAMAGWINSALHSHEQEQRFIAERYAWAKAQSLSKEKNTEAGEQITLLRSLLVESDARASALGAERAQLIATCEAFAKDKTKLEEACSAETAQRREASTRCQTRELQLKEERDTSSRLEQQRGALAEQVTQLTSDLGRLSAAYELDTRRLKALYDDEVTAKNAADVKIAAAALLGKELGKQVGKLTAELHAPFEVVLWQGRNYSGPHTITRRFSLTEPAVNVPSFTDVHSDQDLNWLFDENNKGETVLSMQIRRR